MSRLLRCFHSARVALYLNHHLGVGGCNSYSNCHDDAFILCSHRSSLPLKGLICVSFFNIRLLVPFHVSQGCLLSIRSDCAPGDGPTGQQCRWTVRAASGPTPDAAAAASAAVAVSLLPPAGRYGLDVLDAGPHCRRHGRHGRRGVGRTAPSATASQPVRVPDGLRSSTRAAAGTDAAPNAFRVIIC